MLPKITAGLQSWELSSLPLRLITVLVVRQRFQANDAMTSQLSRRTRIDLNSSSLRGQQQATCTLTDTAQKEAHGSPELCRALPRSQCQAAPPASWLQRGGANARARRSLGREKMGAFAHISVGSNTSAFGCDSFNVRCLRLHAALYA